MTKWSVVIALGIVGYLQPAPEGAPRPFQGAVHAIPGLIEAEHFDEGGEGIAYHDLDAKNHGAPYRHTGVDIDAGPHFSNGYAIGWVKAGEWLVYTVDVAESGTYTLEVAVASKGRGGTFHIELDEKDRTDSIGIPDTGDWTTVRTIKNEITLNAGRQLMRVVMNTDGASGWVGDFDYFRFTRR